MIQTNQAKGKKEGGETQKNTEFAVVEDEPTNVEYVEPKLAIMMTFQNIIQYLIIESQIKEKGLKNMLNPYLKHTYKICNYLIHSNIINL